MIEPVHQHPSDLALAVIAGQLERDLTILDYAALTIGDWTFNFHIIGESHLVTVMRDGTLLFHELLACVDIPAAACAHHHPFADLAAHCYARSGYSVAVTFDQNPPESFLGSQRDSLYVEFPPIAGQTPFTRINWQRQGSSIRWQTLHVYPQAETTWYVHSLSILDTVNYNP